MVCIGCLLGWVNVMVMCVSNVERSRHVCSHISIIGRELFVIVVVDWARGHFGLVAVELLVNSLILESQQHPFSAMPSISHPARNKQSLRIV